jgi:hypothetical protein
MERKPTPEYTASFACVNPYAARIRFKLVSEKHAFIRRFTTSTNNKKLMTLQQELIQKTNSKEDNDGIADGIFRIRELHQTICQQKRR